MKIDGYKFGQKNNWRRWQWNGICERLQKYSPVSRRDAVVLYLSGAEDIDREVARSKGFSPTNLIAIDRSKKVVESVRNNGGLALNADLRETLLALTESKLKIDVLVADFCCGTNDRTKDFIDLILDKSAQIFRGPPIVSCNFMRGRDDGEITRCFSNMHRGRKLFDYIRTFYVSVIIGAGRKGQISEWPPPSKNEVEKALKLIEPYLKPTFSSYRSSGFYMDSIVLAINLQYVNLENESCWIDKEKQIVQRATKNKIAAVAAIRTARNKNTNLLTRAELVHNKCKLSLSTLCPL